MDSLEFKTALNDFGKGLNALIDDLYAATQDDLPAARRRAALSAANNKLKSYHALLAKLDATKKKQAAERFEDQIGELTQFLKQLGEK